MTGNNLVRLLRGVEQRLRAEEAPPVISIQLINLETGEKIGPPMLPPRQPRGLIDYRIVIAAMVPPTEDDGGMAWVPVAGHDES